MVHKIVTNPSTGSDTNTIYSSDWNYLINHLTGITKTDPFTFTVDQDIIKHSTTNAAGDLLKGNGTRFARLARGTANQQLRVNAGGTDIEWATISSAGETNTASNVNLTGTGPSQGVFKQKTGVNFEMRGIDVVSTSRLTVALDGTNNTIDLDIPTGAISNDRINGAAAIAYSKLALSNSIVNNDINTSAAIAKSKLAALDIVNTDVNSSAAIAYSKLNLAGAITLNDLYSNFVKEFEPRGRRRTKFGYSGGTSTGGEGLFNGALSYTGTGTFSQQLFAGGYASRHTTGSVSGNQAGFRSNIFVGERDHETVLRFSFAHNTSTASTKGFIGFVNDTSAFLAGTDSLNAKIGFGLSWDTSVDSNFKIIHNDGTGASVRDNLSTTTALDLVTHDVELIADNPNSRWRFNFDSLTTSNVTTDIPIAGDDLAIQCFIETATAATRQLAIGYFEGDTETVTGFV